MAFTDDDLKRLKEELKKSTGQVRIFDEYWHIDSLIARLEAAERYATYMRKKHPGWYNPQYEDWRKAAGKESK